MPTKAQLSQQIKDLALELGFSACGITSAQPLDEDARKLRNWLDQGLHAGMHYMENHFEKRIDPSVLVEGSKSVILVLLNYYPEQLLGQGDYVIAKYAYGKDYHKLMKRMLKEFFQLIHKEIHPIKGRTFVDSAPVLERSLACRAGLGWLGKNGCLIVPKGGSFFFIGELIVDIELEYGSPIPGYCGSCTRCIDSCPTQAIVSPGVIDSTKCVSYWTIEHKGEIDSRLKGKFDRQIFGCDICQDVCPWNSKASPTLIELLKPSEALKAMSKEDWDKLTEEQFTELFAGTPVKRTGYEGLMRNIGFVGEHSESDF